jgi:antitoxin component HigA of HigAB toxin-antitoxin module
MPSLLTKQDHKAALCEISKLMTLDPDIDTPDADRLDALVTLAQAYEATLDQTPNPCSHSAA